MITMIAAVARNRAIGYKNKLIYWLPNDLKRFKQLTTGHTILMGRRTFESLPKGALPQRRNCVLTRSQKEIPGCECFATWDTFIATCRPDEDIYIICLYKKDFNIEEYYIDIMKDRAETIIQK